MCIIVISVCSSCCSKAENSIPLSPHLSDGSLQIPMSIGRASDTQAIYGVWNTPQNSGALPITKWIAFSISSTRVVQDAAKLAPDIYVLRWWIHLLSTSQIHKHRAISINTSQNGRQSFEWSDCRNGASKHRQVCSQMMPDVTAFFRHGFLLYLLTWHRQWPVTILSPKQTADARSLSGKLPNCRWASCKLATAHFDQG